MDHFSLADTFYDQSMGLWGSLILYNNPNQLWLGGSPTGKMGDLHAYRVLGWISSYMPEPHKYGGLALMGTYVGHRLASCLFISHLLLLNTFFFRLLDPF